MKANDASVLSHVQAWLKDIVIGLGLCPFAKPEFEAGRIHFAVLRPDTVQACIAAITAECGLLDKTPDRETSLLIFPEGLDDFHDYLDVIDIAEAALTSKGYEGVYQLASFHPDYVFDGVEADDAANYTNRSPFPIIHVLREASVEAAVKGYPNPENIPVRNVALTRKMGMAAMQRLLAACFN
mgnify:CR=1 FL=1